jgi:hypothetical protein
VRWLLPLLALALAGCTAARIFQSKVPEPVVKRDAQVEAERQAADLIARKIETPAELKPVAQSLSESLGTPKRSLVDVRAFDLPSAAKRADGDLQAGIREIQEQLRRTNITLAKLQGKEVEGTGLSVLGPGTATAVIALIVLGVIFPPAFTLMGIAYRRLKSTASMIVEQVDEVSKDPAAKEAISKLKSNLKDSMDASHKRVVHSLQRP